MAVYHLNMRILSRGNCQSVVATAAYNNGEKLCDKYIGKTYDYSYRTDVLYKEILLPSSASLEFLDTQRLLDALNNAEKRIDSQMARVIKIALPNELPVDRQIALVKGFVERNFVSRNMCAAVAFHSGLLEQHRKPETIKAVNEFRDNPHAHIIVPIRQIGIEGFYQTKTGSRELNNKLFLLQLRECWAELQNREYERMGLNVRVSHKSLAEQGIHDRKPSIHLGAAAIALESRGIESKRGDKYRSIREENQKREREAERVEERLFGREYVRSR